MQPAPNVKRTLRHNFPLIATKLVVLVFALLTLIMILIPTQSFNVDSNVFCSESKNGNCFRFLFFPLIFGSLMIGAHALSMVLLILLINVYWVSAIVSWCATVVWIAASANASVGVWRTSTRQDAQRPFDPPATWYCFIIFIYITTSCQFLDAAVTTAAALSVKSDIASLTPSRSIDDSKSEMLSPSVKKTKRGKRKKDVKKYLVTVTPISESQRSGDNSVSGRSPVNA